MPQNKIFYLRLCGGLDKFYVKFEASDADTVRRFAEANYGSIWVEVYSEAYFYEVLRRRLPNATRIANPSNPIRLYNEKGTTNND